MRLSLVFSRLRDVEKRFLVNCCKLLLQESVIEQTGWILVSVKFTLFFVKNFCCYLSFFLVSK